MFNRKEAVIKSVEEIGNVPHTAYEKAKAEWAERMGSATVDKGRLFIIAALSVLAVAAMAFALAGLVPLKQVAPYSIHVDKVTGETRAVGITATAAVPNEKQKMYHLAKWVKQLLTMDAFTTERDLSEAFGYTRGKAIEEFRDFLSQSKPIARLRADTTLTRTVQPSTIQFLADNIAQVRVVTETRSSKDSTRSQRYIVLLHFAIDPPKTESEILRNPIGLFITHFTISEELQ